MKSLSFFFKPAEKKVQTDAEMAEQKALNEKKRDEKVAKDNALSTMLTMWQLQPSGQELPNPMSGTIRRSRAWSNTLVRFIKEYHRRGGSVQDFEKIPSCPDVPDTFKLHAHYFHPMTVCGEAPGDNNPTRSQRVLKPSIYDYVLSCCNATVPDDSTSREDDTTVDAPSPPSKKRKVSSHT